LVYAAAALSLVAGLIHAWAMPEHARAWWGYGAFFLVVAIAQVFLSDALLYRPQRRLFLAGVMGNLAVITLYVVTRTVGIPFFGPHAGAVEEMGMIDLLSIVVELALVSTLVVLLRVRRATRPTM
jgi:hypothetical protein